MRKCDTSTSYTIRRFPSLKTVVGKLFFSGWEHWDVRYGFKIFHCDKCYLVLEDEGGNFIKMSYHVDDGLIAHKGEAMWLLQKGSWPPICDEIRFSGRKEEISRHEHVSPRSQTGDG